MSRAPDPSVSRKIDDAGSGVVLPGQALGEASRLSREEWSSRFGAPLEAQEAYERRHAGWTRGRQGPWAEEVGLAASDPSSPFPGWYEPDGPLAGYAEGRSGEGAGEGTGEGSVGVEAEAASGDAAGRSGGDRHQLPPLSRTPRPLWAERIGTRREPPPPPPLTTVFGHRAEYGPGLPGGSRYQPRADRVARGELPGVTDPPDGRFWAAGVAQGGAADPYRDPGAAGGAPAARRKPVVLGPRSAQVVVDGEGHSLGAVFRELAWTHPDTELAAYSIEHFSYNHVALRVQARPGARASAEEVAAVSLEDARGVFQGLGGAMEAALKSWSAEGKARA